MIGGARFPSPARFRRRACAARRRAVSVALRCVCHPRAAALRPRERSQAPAARERPRHVWTPPGKRTGIGAAQGPRYLARRRPGLA